MTKKSDAPAIRFKGFSDAWEQRKVGDFLTESRVRGNTGVDAKKLTVKLWGKGVVEKNDFGGSEHTQYFTRRKGQFIYSKLDFLNSAFGVIPEKLDNYESTADLPAFDSDGMNPYFMFFIAIQKSFYLKHGSIADGSRKAKRIHVDTFLNMPISVPTIDEQNLIVEYLQCVDHLITLHQRKFEKLTNVKKSMLEKMFPQNGSSYPEIRFKGFTDPWEQRKFEEIAVRSSVICSDDTLPRVEYEDIVSGTGRLNKDIYAKQSSKSGIAFHQGDVLYGKLRPYLQNWLLPTFDGLAVGDFWVLQPQNADSSFLYRLIQSRQFDEVANQSTGTKMPRADWKLVSKTVFSIPSNIGEQAAIGTYFTALESLITLHQRELEKLQNIKKSMLEKMFV